MTEEPRTHIATVSILVKERGSHVREVNDALSRHADRIVARLGVNLDRLGADGADGLITVVIRGTAADVNALTDELDALYGIVAKADILD